MTTATQQTGTTLTQESYFVFYGEHDMGSPAGVMVREGIEEAYRSAKLMEQCGYHFVDVRHALSVGQMGNEA